ncbi:MAG: patatin-like phospholipase family protein [Bacteroidales bacterium]|nr:patatin-like phospholipase family protein [Bacteroidales bacterium]MDD3860281.1 patatin-like phospholipase family protein [Bacteroidales bacterium]
MKKYKLGIALSGGGTRGFAHLGVLKALNEKGIYPEIVAGTSAGSIAGVLYCAGYSPDEIFKLFKKKKFSDFTKMHLPTNGLFSLDNLTQIIRKAVVDDSFEKLKIPFIVCVANLHTGKAEYINTGSLFNVVQASSSIPILFSPVKIGKNVYVDGGLIDNLPVRPLVRKCEKIIAVNIFPNEKVLNVENLFQVATRTFQISINKDIRYDKRRCHYYLEPPEMAKYNMLETKHMDKIFDLGYQYCKKMKFDL